MEYISTKRASLLLGVGRMYLHNMIFDGSLRAYKDDGNRWHVLSADVDFILAQPTEHAPETRKFKLWITESELEDFLLKYPDIRVVEVSMPAHRDGRVQAMLNAAKARGVTPRRDADTPTVELSVPPPRFEQFDTNPDFMLNLDWYNVRAGFVGRMIYPSGDWSMVFSRKTAVTQLLSARTLITVPGHPELVYRVIPQPALSLSEKEGEGEGEGY